MFDERTKEYNIVLYTNREVIIIPISKWKQITEDLNGLLKSIESKPTCDCKKCNGTGVYSDIGLNCPRCNGTGMEPS